MAIPTRKGTTYSEPKKKIKDSGGDLSVTKAVVNVRKSQTKIDAAEKAALGTSTKRKS